MKPDNPRNAFSASLRRRNPRLLGSQSFTPALISSRVGDCHQLRGSRKSSFHRRAYSSRLTTPAFPPTTNSAFLFSAFFYTYMALQFVVGGVVDQVWREPGF